MAAAGNAFLSSLYLLGLLLAAGCATTRPELVCRADLMERNDYNRTWKLGPEFSRVDYLTIHNTAEPLTAAQERDRVNFRRDDLSVSFHFAVDEKEAVQILPLDHVGWHAGDGGKGPGNSRSIGIEICRSQWRGDPEARYDRAQENAAQLAAWLLDVFALPMEALRKHQDWSGKYCPHRLLESDGWEAFKARVAALRRDGIRPEFRATPAAFARESALLVLGEQRFMLTATGEEFATPQAAAEALARLGAARVTVSSWRRGDDGTAVLDALKNEKIVPAAYFILDPALPDYERRNLIP